MCGIAGWAGDVAADATLLEDMGGAIVHRGPDDGAIHHEPGRVGLSFRRLSIIDLECGNQPFASEDGAIVAICNGEIYNFAALREDLRRRGHRFTSGSDCEVLPHLYEEHGDAFLTRLRGMFAVALWDGRRRRLVLARDRLGVKPLYWAEVEGGIAFGSEPAAILASGLVAPRPDLHALGQYLTLQYVPPPRSGFAGVHKLAPGEQLVFENGQAVTSRWWSLEYEPKRGGSEDELLEELDAALEEATRLRLVADVPLGAFLSGGIDSSLVVAYMARARSTVRTFSIDFRHEGFSEGAHARRVASIYGTQHEEFVVEPELLPAIARAARSTGEPFADVSMIPTYALSELTRRHVTVALSGDGGDEAFAGYPRHLLGVTMDRVGPLARLARPLQAVAHRAPAGRGRRYLQRGLAVAGLPAHDRYAQLMTHFAPDDVAGLAVGDAGELHAGSRDAWDRVLALPGERGVDRYLALDVTTYLPGDLLVKVDRMSMAHALEVRSPLLDHVVHELAASLPRRMKLRGRTTKWALKALATRHGLPDDLVHRPKQGFGVPIGAWFRGELRPWVTEVLTDPATRGRGLFRADRVDTLLREHLDGRAHHETRLWNLLMLELWHRAWIDAPEPITSSR